MTRLLSRITRRRAEGDSAGAGPADQPTVAPAAPPPADRPTEVAPAGARPPEAAPLPAGAEPVAATRPGFRERSRLRRRLQYLRRVRELGFRDLGGLVFDQHRFARPDESLVQAKLTALAAVDGELRAIERALDDERPLTELREVGVSACARCGALVGSDARFCSACGTAVRGAREVAPLVAGPASISPPPVAAPAEQPSTEAPHPIEAGTRSALPQPAEPSTEAASAVPEPTEPSTEAAQPAEAATPSALPQPAEAATRSALSQPAEPLQPVTSPATPDPAGAHPERR